MILINFLLFLLNVQLCADKESKSYLMWLILVRDGGIDEIPRHGHPVGNQHTKGSPTRRPATSIFGTYLYLMEKQVATT